MTGFYFKPIFNQNQLKKMLAKFKGGAVEKIIILLARAGEFFVSHARQNHTYQNRTGNLTSSIGYVVVNNGEVVKLSNFEAVSTNDRVIVVDFTVKSGKYAGKQVKFNATLRGGTGKTGTIDGKALATVLAAQYPTGTVLIGLAGMEYGKYVEAMGFDVITGAAIATEAFIKRSVLALMSKI